MSTLADLVKVLTGTVGTGVITLGSKVSGFRSFTDAGIPNGATVTYGISDNGEHEVGRGVFNSVAGTLTRTLIASSTGGLLPLTGGAVVSITAVTEDLVRGRTLFVPTVTGTVNAIVANVSVDVPVSALAPEDVFIVPVTGPNTITNPTININGTGAKTIKDPTGAALAIKAWGTQSIVLRYDGAAFRLEGRLRAGRDPFIPCDCNNPNAGSFILTSQAGFVGSDNLQEVTFRPTTGNSAGATATHPDFFGGVATPILLQNGAAIPANLIKNGYPVSLRAKTTGGDAWIIVEPGYNQQMAIIPLKTASTGSAITATLAEAGAKYDATFGEGFMMASFFANADKPAGGGQLTITGVIGPVAILDFDGATSLDVGAWKLGSLVIVSRIPTGQPFAGNFKLVYVGMPLASIATVLAGIDLRSPVNSAGVAAAIAQSAENIGRANWLIANEIMSTARPTKIWRPNARRLIIEVGTYASDYRGIYAGSKIFGDCIRFELMNLSGWYHTGQTSTELWVLVSIWTNIAGKWVPHMNYTFDAVTGATADNGQIFSVNEAVSFFGKTADTLAEVQATNGQGPGHGYINAISGTMNVFGGFKNGQPIPDGADILNGFYKLNPGDPPIFCNYAAQNSVWNILCPDGVTVGIVYSTYKAFGNGRQLRQLFTLAFQNNIKMLFGYASMLKYRLPTRFEGRNTAGVAYAPRTTGLKDNHQEIFPAVKSLIGFYEPPAGTPDTSFKGHGLEWKLVDSYVPCRVNGVEPGGYVNHTGETITPIVTDEDSGPAFRSQTWGGGTDFYDISNQTYAFMTDISGVRADAA